NQTEIVLDFASPTPTNEYRVETFADALSAAQQLGYDRVDFRTTTANMNFDGRQFTFYNRPTEVVRGNPFAAAGFEKRAIQGLTGLLSAESLHANYILKNPTDVGAWNMNYWLRNDDRDVTVRGFR